MKKRLLSILLSLTLVFTFMPAGALVAFADGGEYAGKVVILHSNDVHGALDSYKYMAGLKAQYKAAGADVILADAGDYSQGTAYVSTSKGASAVTMMNAVGYDVATLGNHEFDYGYAQLKKNLKNAKFKVVCADIKKNGKTIYPGHTIIKTKDGVKVGFFGLDTPEAQTKVNPALIKGLSFLTGSALSDCAKSEAAALKKAGADVVIALVHLGVDEESEPYRSVDLFKNAADMGVDLVIDGHSHTVMTPGDGGDYSDYQIQSTGKSFANIGVVVIDEATKKIEKTELIAVGEDTPASAKVEKAAKKIIDKVDAKYKVAFAKTKVELNGEKEANPDAGIVNGVRDGETNMGDLIATAMKWSVKSTGGIKKVDADHIVAITNGGGIRATIKRGKITKLDINTVLPFGNTVAVVYVKGEKLLEALEASTYCTPTSVGAFPQIAGMKIAIDTTKEYDANDEVYPGSTYYGPKTINRVTIKSVNGKKFNHNALYAVVTNNFCAAGGDTYYAFASAKTQFDTGIPMDEAVMSYIKKVLKGTIGKGYANPKGRITIIK